MKSAKPFFKMTNVSVLSIIIFAVMLCMMTATGAFSADKIKLRFQDWRLAEIPTGKIMEQMFREFEKQNPGIIVEGEPIPAKERERKFVIQSKAGNPPDIVRMVTSTAPKFADMGVLLPLDEYYKKEFQIPYDQIYAPHLLDASQWKGTMYGLPSEGGIYFLYINSKLYGEAGLDPNKPPQTWDEWLEHLKKVTNPSKNIYGTMVRAAVSVGSPLYLKMYFLANGASFFNKDYTEVVMDSPEGIEAFKFWVELFTKHKVVPPGATEIGYTEYIGAFAQGRIATLPLHGVGRGSILKANPDIEEYMVPALMPGKHKVALARGTVHGISKKCKHPEAAWKLLQFIGNKENHLKLWQSSGIYPGLLSALNDPSVVSNPFAKIVAEGSKTAQAYPLIPIWPKTANILVNSMQEALLGVKPPEQALREAADKARELLKEYREKQ